MWFFLTSKNARVGQSSDAFGKAVSSSSPASPWGMHPGASAHLWKVPSERSLGVSLSRLSPRLALCIGWHSLPSDRSPIWERQSAGDGRQQYSTSSGSSISPHYAFTQQGPLSQPNTYTQLWNEAFNFYISHQMIIIPWKRCPIFMNGNMKNMDPTYCH